MPVFGRVITVYPLLLPILLLLLLLLSLVSLVAPVSAVLDEATSSLSEEDEMSLYSTLKQLNITILSIGHRSTLQRVGDLYFCGP